jgi:hypothetical protein
MVYYTFNDFKTISRSTTTMIALTLRAMFNHGGLVLCRLYSDGFIEAIREPIGSFISLSMVDETYIYVIKDA